MAKRTFVNEIDPVEVSIAIERLLIADYPTVWSPARIDLGSLPTGFRDLGAVVEDTPVMRVSREKFQLRTGLPRVLQYQTVIGFEGQFEARLHSNSWRKVQFAFGNYTAVSSATFVSTVASVTADQTTLTLATTTTSLPAGRQFIVCPIGQQDNADSLEVRVGTITNGWTIGVAAIPPRSMAPNWGVYIYDRVAQPIGGRAIKFYSLLGVADFLDGVQIVHEMRRVSPADEWEEAFRPDANGQVPLMFDALAWTQAIAGCDEQVIAQRHYFPTLNQTCL